MAFDVGGMLKHTFNRSIKMRINLNVYQLKCVTFDDFKICHLFLWTVCDVKCIVGVISLFNLKTCSVSHSQSVRSTIVCQIRLKVVATNRTIHKPGQNMGWRVEVKADFMGPRSIFK